MIPEWGRSSGGGHGNPLQYSCLEYPMKRGAWQATVHRVSKSQTQLKWQHAQYAHMFAKLGWWINTQNSFPFLLSNLPCLEFLFINELIQNILHLLNSSTILRIKHCLNAAFNIFFIDSFLVCFFFIPKISSYWYFIFAITFPLFLLLKISNYKKVERLITTYKPFY